MLFSLNAARKFFFEPRRVNQIVHAQADARRLVAIGRADATLGRADFVFALEHLALRVQFAVIRKNDVRRLAQDEILRADLDADFFQSLNFLDEADRVNDHAIADDAQFALAQDAGRHEVQDIFLPADENGVAGVVAAGVTDDDIRLLGEHINDFAFAFVAPLGANENRICHNFSK